MDTNEWVASILDKNISAFLDRIYNMVTLNPLDLAKKQAGFYGVLNPANPDYYRYAFYEKRLERYIRELITSSIQEMLYTSGSEVFIPHNESNQLFVVDTTEAYEWSIPFEFIVKRNNVSIAYRYTPIAFNNEREGKRFLRLQKIDKLYVIQWENDTQKSTYKYPCNNFISARDFFNDYYSNDIYEQFIRKMSNAVESANNIIGFQTIPSLSLRYLSDFKIELENYYSNLDFENLQFIISGDSIFSNISMSTDDTVILCDHFKHQKLYRALFGSEEFAKCFVTSEYLYRVFQNGGSFDYTAVVCGYLKSVEQLLYALINHFIGKLSDAWIETTFKDPIDNRPGSKYREKMLDRIIPSNGKISQILKRQVKFAERNRPFFNTMLNSMIEFFEDQKSLWLISEEGRLNAILALKNFTRIDRNEHFHKDNINLLEDVSKIRKNTIVIFYYVLGGINLLCTSTEAKEMLGVFDPRFDELYRAIIAIPKGIRKFIIEGDNGKTIYAIRPLEQEMPIFSASGNLTVSSVLFIRVSNFDESHYDLSKDAHDINAQFKLDSRYLPRKVWYVSQMDNNDKHLVWERRED